MNGNASWYDLPGHSTATLEPFNENAMTAAMRNVPLGTVVTVRYLPPGSNIYRSINVTVNDRGPYGKNYVEKGVIIDLTPRAFDELTNKHRDLGIVPVQVIVPAPPAPPLSNQS